MVVDIVDDGYWGFDMDNIGFFYEEFFCFGVYCFDDWFGEEFFFVKMGDIFVEVDGGCKIWWLVVVVEEVGNGGIGRCWFVLWWLGVGLWIVCLFGCGYDVCVVWGSDL